MIPYPAVHLFGAAGTSTGLDEYLPLAVAISAFATAFTVAWWNQMQGRRDRRRDLYSAAYKAVVAWAEMYYRVRRRDPEKPYEIVELFHELQGEIDYHDGWISIESPELARAYREFVRLVKTKTEPTINTAWTEPPCKPRDDYTSPSGANQPSIEAERRRFLADVNDHLSWNYKRRRALKERYPGPRTRTM